MSTEKETTKVSVAEAQVILLNEVLETLQVIATQTKRTEEMTQAMLPEGIVEPLKTLNVTDKPQTVYPPHHASGKYWFSVKITNDGPDNCKVIINTEKSSSPREINVDETYGVEFKTAIIRDLYFYCESGETASVRITGVR